MKRKLKGGFSRELLQSLVLVSEEEMLARRELYERERRQRREHTRTMKRLGIWL